jgi:hypothetical protein
LLIANMGAPRPGRAFQSLRLRGEHTGLAASPAGRFNFRLGSHVTFTPVCGDSPDYRGVIPRVRPSGARRDLIATSLR